MPRIEYPAGSGGGGGGGAPTNATYLTLSLDGTLTNERVFTPAAQLSATDGGAGGTYTLGLATAGTAGVYAYPSSLTTDAYGRVTSVTAGVAPTVSGWTDGGSAVYLTTSTDVVSVGSNTPVTNRKFSVYNTGTDLGVSVVTAASTDNVIETFVSGEANLRWSVNGNGITSWGAGGASAPDLRIRRSGTSTLTIDNGGTGSVAVNPGGDGVSAIGSSTLRWLDIVANTHRVFPSAGAVNASSSLASGALKLGAGGATALDTQISRTGVKTLTVDDNAAGGVLFSVLGTTQVQRFQTALVTTNASPYAVTSTDCVVLANPGGAQTINLPAAAAGLTGRMVTVKRANNSVNVVTVATLGGNIDGVATRALAGGTYDSITVTCDGTNWWII